MANVTALHEEWLNVPVDGIGHVAAEILALLEPGAVIGLVGDLGAGKTAFAAAMARGLGIRETIESPTFIVMQDFKTGNENFKTFRHFDLYRLESWEEAVARGLEPYFSLPDGITLVEWATKFPNVPLTHRLRIEIDGETRDYYFDKVV